MEKKQKLRREIRMKKKKIKKQKKERQNKKKEKKRQVNGQDKRTTSTQHSRKQLLKTTRDTDEPSCNEYRELLLVQGTKTRTLRERRR